MRALLGRPHERRERHTGVFFGLFDHVHQLLRQQVHDERSLGGGRRRVKLAALWRQLLLRRHRAIAGIGGGAAVRHPVHAEPAFGPEHRFADLAGRRAVAAAAALDRIVVRELIVFFDVAVVRRRDRHHHRLRRRGRLRFHGTACGGDGCPVAHGPSGPAAVRRKSTARLLPPVRRRVQAVAGRLGFYVHHRHPRHVHVLLDADAQRGAQARRGRRRQIARQRVHFADHQRVVDVLLTVLRLTVTVVRLVPDVAGLREKTVIY